MKHYVVVLDWAVESEEAVSILGVTHSYKEALEIFNENLQEQKSYTEQYGYTVYTNSEGCYEAGIEGSWRMEHTSLYIEEVCDERETD